MHDRVRALQNPVQCTPVENVCPDQFKSLGENFVAGTEIVENDNVMAGAPQGAGGMATDIPRSAYHENNHSELLFRSSGRLTSGSIPLYTEVLRRRAESPKMTTQGFAM
jgi:hypothetical protein